MDYPGQYSHLTEEQINHFLVYGYIRLKACFTREKASEWTSTIFPRLGVTADKSTWTEERVNMPPHHWAPVERIAPKAWYAICELLGGADRIAGRAWWGDGFIVNFGKDEYEGRSFGPRDLYGWHVDGDSFVHFLDSKEQGLLVIPIFSDIAPQGGGTIICPDSIPHMARHLYNNPDGVMPNMSPRKNPHPRPLWFLSTVRNCQEFHELTGEVGDVYILHPLMIHSASKNCLRIPRIITNPSVSLKEPFNFDREDPRDYSLVEWKTLMSLGTDRLRGWSITSPREKIVPDRVFRQEEAKRLEVERLRMWQSKADALRNIATQRMQQNREEALRRFGSRR